jgi:hypothetical protein
MDDVLPDYGREGTTDKSLLLDVLPESTTGSKEITTASPLGSTSVGPPERPEIAITVHQATDATEFIAHTHMPVYLTMPQPADPILYADPYPYSLSTPISELRDSLRQVALGDERDMVSDDHSSSPSSLTDEEDKGMVSNEFHSETDDMELLYPSEAAETPILTSRRIEESPPQADGRALGPEVVGAVDADGLNPVALGESRQGQIVADEDPYKVTSNDSEVAPRPLEMGTSPGVEKRASPPEDKDAYVLVAILVLSLRQVLVPRWRVIVQTNKTRRLML